MENQMIQSLYSQMHYEEKLILVKEIYHYLEINEHKRSSFFNIGCLIYGLVIWAATSYYQVSSLSLKILSLIVRAMKMNFLVYSQCTCNVAMMKLKDSKPVARNAARALLIDIFSHSTASPEALHNKIVNRCLSSNSCRAIKQGLLIINETLLFTQKFSLKKNIRAVHELKKHKNEAVRSAAIETYQLIQAHLRKDANYRINSTDSDSGFCSHTLSSSVDGNSTLTPATPPRSTNGLQFCYKFGQTVSKTNMSSSSSVYGYTLTLKKSTSV